ncbi:hypothetical protein niasHS_010862 [Heterodera schachtii]|uniref:BTB domain-containing protein n=1 Tax=Heterodera schachtii TaxID=97005 RepID=A0ABD2IYX1_HETSC
MSNFLRRLVRSKSRSNSPQKAIPSQCQCAHLPPNEEGWMKHLSDGTQQQKCPLVPNHIEEGKQQQSKANRHQKKTVVEEKLCANSVSSRPSSHFFHSSPDSARRFLSHADEPGTSSQEFLGTTLWPNSPTFWSLRNSHSNPTSSADSHIPSAINTKQATEKRMAPAQSLLFQLQRPRSSSPRNNAQGAKCISTAEANERATFRSQSPAKKTAAKTKDYLLAQCHLEGCSATILVEDTRFLVCKHQLSHASDFFRSLFLNTRALPLEGVRQIQADEYVIQVSSLRHPPQSLQFQWFLETSVPSPILRDVSDELLETCMRLCKRFAARGLEMRCTRFIQQNVEAKPPMMALCWLNWAFKHRFHRAVQEACLPVVARLSLQSLEKHRQMVPEAVFSDILVMKLRTVYQQASGTFHTIHRMDHFHVEMEKCPRCGRQREQGRVRVQVSPCHKLIGCELCMRDFVCELEGSSSADLQAYWQCEHGIWPLSERTECCRCQLPLYRANRMCAGEGIGTTGTEMAQHRRRHSNKASSTASRS